MSYTGTEIPETWRDPEALAAQIVEDIAEARKIADGVIESADALAVIIRAKVPAMERFDELVSGAHDPADDDWHEVWQAAGEYDINKSFERLADALGTLNHGNMFIF